MQKQILKRIFPFVIVLLWAIVSSLAALAAETDQLPIVRAGIFTGPGYAEQDQDGKWHGIDIEMLENIAQTAGFRVEFIEFESSKGGLAALENNEIDMLADIAKTPEREGRYLFCEYEQGNSSTNIFVPQEDDRWIYGDAQQIKRMTLGAERDNIAGVDLRKWCQQYGFEPTLIEYDTAEKAIAAVKSGEVDGYVDGEDALDGFRSILSFAPSSYYLVFARSNTDLKSRVDAALSQIYRQNPLYEKELLEKYIGITLTQDIAFTWQEKEYLATNPRLRIAVLQDDAPYFYGTPDSPKGFLPQFYEQVSAKTGLQFSYQIYATQDEAVHAVVSGQADIVGIYSAGLPQAYEAGISLTKKYGSVSTVMISRTGTNVEGIHKIAVKTRSLGTILQVLPPGMKNAELQSFTTASDCFEALKNGSADALIIGLPSATYLLNQTNSSLYTITPFSSVNLDLCAGVAQGNRQLVSILDKSINSMAYSMNGIIANNTVSQDNLQTMMAKIPAAAIVAFAVIMLLIIFLLIWAVLSLIKSRRTKIAAIRAQAKVQEQRILAEAAEKSAEEKNAFFSNISHDMRTPLNAVNGFVSLAIKEGCMTKKNEYLSKIQSAGELLNDLINDTLTLFKVNNGKLELKLQPVTTAELIEMAADPIRQLAEQRGVLFTVDVTGRRERVLLADKLNLGKIILNLLSNAIKFTPSGGHVWLIVKDDPPNSEDPDIVIIVRDEGIGMSPEFLKHVFEPFSQERRQGYEALGTGLGLSIVNKLIALMGGTITVESAMEEGTVFTVRLHLPEVKDHHAVPREAVPTEHRELAGKQILLCEDNLLNREIAVALLHDKNLLVDTAVDGQQGLDMFAASAPGYYDAVLMDARMPVMDGCEATRAIRKLERDDARTIPILALTADAFEEDTQRFLDAGMNAHLIKPINPQILYAALAKYIP